VVSMADGLFEPNQIKSAIGNKGKFSAYSPDIRDAYEEEQHPRREHGRWTSGGGGVLYHHAPSEYRASILKYGLLRSKSWAAAVARERGDSDKDWVRYI
jgi:hypothetical protein